MAFRSSATRIHSWGGIAWSWTGATKSPAEASGLGATKATQRSSGDTAGSRAGNSINVLRTPFEAFCRTSRWPYLISTSSDLEKNPSSEQPSQIGSLCPGFVAATLYETSFPLKKSRYPSREPSGLSRMKGSDCRGTGEALPGGACADR